MRKQSKPGHSPQYGPPTFISLLTGWVQQGVESFFATQRILVDVAMRQNVVATKTMRDGIFDPEHSPVAILTELAMEGTSSFVEAQKILLNLAQQENEIMMNGGKERLAGSMRAMALTDLVRRSLDTFIRMQQDFLATTSKQTMHWLEAVKAGKGYQNTHLADLAREGMDTFVQAQKKFLDVIAQESARATSGKHDQVKTMKKTELSKLASEATNAFIDAQKKLLDVVGRQTNVNLKMATKTMGLLSPARLMPMANLTGEGVKSFVSAEKALIESMIKPRNVRAAGRRPMHTVHHPKTAKTHAAHAGA
ncbi:MAG: hypothetical protein LAO09_13955 [Acidobacteriia bacterium]|nr:hypothetical protein [Terriglobia bacterium]